MQPALLTQRVSLVLVRHPNLRSTGPLSLGAPSPLLGDELCLVNRSSELYVRLSERHSEQARTSLAELAAAMCPVDNGCGRIGRHPVFLCSLPSVPVHR